MLIDSLHFKGLNNFSSKTHLLDLVLLPAGLTFTILLGAKYIFLPQSAGFQLLPLVLAISNSDYAKHHVFVLGLELLGSAQLWRKFIISLIMNVRKGYLLIRFLQKCMQR